MQPEEKSNELIRELNALLEREAKGDITAFELARVKRDAKNLPDNQRVAAYVALGAVARLEKDYDSMHSNHKNAIALDQYNYYPYLNYAVSLFRIGSFYEAVSPLEKAYKFNQGDNQVISGLIEANYYAGRVRDSLSWLETWRATFPDNPHSYEFRITSACRFLDANEIPDSKVQRLVNIAIETLRDHGLKSWEVDDGVVEDEDSDWFSYVYFVNEHIDTVVDLNVNLAEKIAQIEDNDEARRIVIRFKQEDRE